MDRLSQQDFFSCVSQAWFRGRLRSAEITSGVVDDFYHYFTKKNTFSNISSVEFFFFISFFLIKRKDGLNHILKFIEIFVGLSFFFFGFFKISKRREVEWEKRNVAELNPRARGLTVSSGPISSSRAFSLLPAPSSPCQSTCLSDFLRSATDFHRFFFPFIVKQPFFQNTVSHECDDVCLFFDDENRIAFENNDT